MQHVISYLHEAHEDLSLPMYNKIAEPSFEYVFELAKEISYFIVDLTKLRNIKEVTGNDGEKIEHHGIPLRQTALTLSWR